MICLVCYTKNRGVKLVSNHGVFYYRCKLCGSINADGDISKFVETQNDNPQPRNNRDANNERFWRLTEALSTPPKTVLDFGCGQGEFVNFLIAKDVAAIGVDLSTGLTLADVAPKKFEAITMIEVIEHLNDARFILHQLSRCLLSGGVLMIETTFADVIDNMENHPYVDPRIGHVCIISRGGLERILPPKIVFERQINSHVLIFRKL